MRIFISRNLSEKSIFRTAPELSSHDVVGQSMLRFEAVDFVMPPENYEWLFFYSPRGVKYFFEQTTSEFLVDKLKLGAIGSTTAASIEALGHQVDFIGSGNPDNTAKAFYVSCEPQNVCFIQAEKSRQSIERLANSKIKTSRLVVYRSLPVTFNDNSFDLFLFTSPANFQTFINQNKIPRGSHLVAIGETTKNAISSKGFSNIILAKNTSELGLLEAILPFINKRDA